MTSLDMRTILFDAMAVDIICTLVIVALWRQSRKRFDGIAFWVADYLLQNVGLLLVVLRGVIADWISIVLANTLIVAGAFLGYRGLEQFVGKRSTQIHNYVLLAAFPLIHGYFAFIDSNLAARNINFSAVLLIIFSQCAWLALRRVDASMRRFTYWTGLVFVAFCLTGVFRIIWFLNHLTQDSDFFHSGAIDPFAQVAFQTLIVLLTYSLILMVNKRLLIAIQTQEEKFSKAFHSSPYAITLTRLSDGRVFEVNDGFRKVTGYPEEEVLGKTTYDLHLWAHLEDREGIVNALTQRGVVRGVERQFMHKSGDFFTGLYSAEVISINNELCILASINDITERKQTEQERERLISEREKALSEVKVLSGMLPICASCKKIRDDKGYWSRIESYIQSHSQAQFTHGICPECLQQLYPDTSSKGNGQQE